ncbi:MAG: hypothetical protein VW920_05320 [Gammaproteobacteria bacterium]
MAVLAEEYDRVALEEEFRDLQQKIDDLKTLLTFIPVSSPVAEPKIGMVMYSDGTTTDFGGHKGRGLYRYDYLNPDANTNLGWIHFAHDDMEPYVIERDSGTVDYTQSNDFVLLKQTTNDGTSYTVNLPSPSANEYRTIRFVSDASVDSNDTVILDAGPGITIDSSQTYTIDRAFEGVTLFSDGSNWIIIQAKDK